MTLSIMQRQMHAVCCTAQTRQHTTWDQYDRRPELTTDKKNCLFAEVRDVLTVRYRRAIPVTPLLPGHGGVTTRTPLFSTARLARESAPWRACVCLHGYNKDTASRPAGRVPAEKHCGVHGIKHRTPARNKAPVPTAETLACVQNTKSKDTAFLKFPRTAKDVDVRSL